MTSHVSVVIAAWNAREWLPEALQSVLAQTHPHDRLDVVLVDDGSTDGTAELAEQWLAAGDVAYAVIRHDRPRGPSAARNVGWRQARGEWIQFLDADDLLDSMKVALQSRVACNAPPQVAAIFSPWGRLLPQASGWREQAATQPKLAFDPVLEVLLPDNFIHIGSQIFRCEWLETVAGFDEAHWLIEDVDLQLRLLMQGARFQSAVSEQPLFWYRQRPGSLSRSDSRGFIEACVRNAKLAEAFWRRNNALTARRTAFLTEQYYAATRVLIDLNSPLFEELVQRIQSLCPAFEPPQRSVRWLTHLFGYRRAEQLAGKYRRLKSRTLRDRQRWTATTTAVSR